jgi:hypothetical protein
MYAESARHLPREDRHALQLVVWRSASAAVHRPSITVPRLEPSITLDSHVKDSEITSSDFESTRCRFRDK